MKHRKEYCIYVIYNQISRIKLRKPVKLQLYDLIDHNEIKMNTLTINFKLISKKQIPPSLRQRQIINLHYYFLNYKSKINKK